MILEKAREIRVLILKHLRNELTPEEDVRLKAWIAESDNNRQLFGELSDEGGLNELVKDYYAFRNEVDLHKYEARVVQMPERRIGGNRYARTVAIAAGILIVMSIGGYLWLRPDTKQVAQTNNTNRPSNTPIPPGKDGAILTLGDGTQIVLDSAANGRLADQGRMTIEHKDGQISYRETGAQPGNVVLNTTSTPRGRQYKLQLSDGTSIWLNTESAVTYPTQFTGNKREISIKGEVYIEAAHNQRQPFIVNIANSSSSIEVLGTRFAVNAYPDEPYVKTTLLEGSIRLTTVVKDKNTVTTLKPGEQVKAGQEQLQLIKEADTEEAIAFINGYFSFRGSNIQAVMRQLEKWYDLEVRFAPGVSTQLFQGEIQRNLPLPTVLKILERNGFQFTVEGNRVEVK